MPSADVETDRAAHLRTLARRVEALRLLDLPFLIGENTWVGPTASACHDELTRLTRLVRADAQQLRSDAHRLEMWR